MERQFCVRSWMDVLVPFVHVTESAHNCYLQKCATTKQVFRIVGFFRKKVLSLWLQSLWSCKSWRNEYQVYWALHWSVFPVHGTLWVRSTPSSFSTMDSSTGSPSLFVSTMESSTDWVLSSVSGGGWRPFYIAGSSNSLKALVQIKYATLGLSQPGTMINPMAPTALLTCLSCSLLNWV